MRPPGGLVVRTPAAYRIEVLQRVAKREEVPVTVHAGLGGKRARLRSDRQLRFHGLRVWKRLWCGCAEEPRAHPERTCRRRGVTGVGAMLMPGRDHVDTSVTKQPCPLRRGQHDAAELCPGDAGNTVVMRQLLVQKRVVRVPQLDRVAILP